MHTVKQMRRGAIWLPGVSERAVRPAEPGALWREPTIGPNRSWQPPVPPLPEEVERHLDEILEQARRELVTSRGKEEPQRVPETTQPPQNCMGRTIMARESVAGIS